MYVLLSISHSSPFGYEWQAIVPGYSIQWRRLAQPVTLASSSHKHHTSQHHLTPQGASSRADWSSSGRFWRRLPILMCWLWQISWPQLKKKCQIWVYIIWFFKGIYSDGINKKNKKIESYLKSLAKPCSTMYLLVDWGSRKRYCTKILEIPSSASQAWFHWSLDRKVGLKCCEDA